MMVILVNLELQKSIDLSILPRVGCIFKVLTEPGSIMLVESVYFGSEFYTRVKNMTCINNKFNLAL